MTLPRPLVPMLDFVRTLRTAGFAVAPEQTQAFIASIGLLGPRSFMDVRRAAHATLAPDADARELFDAIFDAIFLGRVLSAPAPGETEDLTAYDAGNLVLLPEATDEEPSGAEASSSTRLFERRFEADDADRLRGFVYHARRRLPVRRARRLRPGKGRLADPRRAFREMMRRDGEIIRLPRRERTQRQRRVLLLVDVSGSMKTGTEDRLRLAHALVQAADRAEVFTLGTRLTRVTPALRHSRQSEALARISGLVADWDGGTRLGDALLAFLSVPRFTAFARGAFVVVLSDGLERGGPEALVAATARLNALAWSLLWLTPLAGDAGFEPRTAALAQIRLEIDRLGDGSGTGAIVDEILYFAKGARDEWRPRR